MKESEDRIRRIASPLRLFCQVLAVVFVGELLVMFLLPVLLPGAARIVVNFADSLLLTFLVSPFLWILIVRPLRNTAEARIRKLNTELVLHIDKLRNAQEELVRRERFATIGQMADNMGRELRNILGGVSNAVYFLKSRMPDADEVVTEYLEIIKSESDKSIRLINSLLDFSLPRAPVRTPARVAELARESLGKCRMPENITVGFDIPDDLPLVEIDAMQIGQVLQNLMANAVQAMPGGGALRVAARRRQGLDPSGPKGTGEGGLAKSPITNHQSLVTDGDFVEISVGDTGEGISPENMKRLFQPLFTTRVRGIGLGLAVSRQLAEANGGRIEVESEVGKGTTFRVVLPVGSGLDI